MARRKHIIAVLFSIIGLLVGNESAFAQANISSPSIYCINVDSAGTATVTWGIPNDTNNTFTSYNIDTSTIQTANYGISSVVTSMTQSSVLVTGINANTKPYFFYGFTNTTKGLSTPGDTVESIFLSLTNTPGVAILSWNAMSTPNLSGFDGWYKIYRQYNFVWTLIDSTKSLFYKDTINYCSANLKYKIVTDEYGCQSSSNWVKGFFQSSIVPISPIMDTVSVGPGGNIDITWLPSPSKNVIGYLVYESIGGIWTLIDSAKGINNTYYNFTGGSPGTGSISFCIAAYDSCSKLSPLSNDQKTIYLQQKTDPCAQTNTLSWNSYVNLVPGIWHYNVYVSTNGGKFTLLDTTSNTTYIQTGDSIPETYCYLVAVVDISNHSITASSNIICYQVTVPPPPKFSYLRSATVINNSSQNQVNWYIDTGASIAEYLVTRADVPGGKQTEVGTVPATNKVYYSFTDPTANPNSQSYAYYILSKDSCNYIINTTNVGQTMFLTALGNSTGQNVLNWNNYTKWDIGVARYDIYRDEDQGPYTKVGSIFDGPGLTYTDDVSAIITGQGVFGYYIEAIEQGPNGYPFIQDTSTSNIAEAYQDPRMYIPNAFNPRGVNKIFKPVGVFVDVQNYDFTIFNRWGQLIFETTDVNGGWDGTYHGPLVEEGVYIYHIEYISSKGEYFNQRGWVMMLK